MEVTIPAGAKCSAAGADHFLANVEIGTLISSGPSEYTCESRGTVVQCAGKDHFFCSKCCADQRVWCRQCGKTVPLSECTRITLVRANLVAVKMEL